MSKSNYAENLTLKLLMASAPAGFTRTTSARYVALHLADPGEDGANGEAAVAGYSRVQRDASDANWPVTNDNCINAATITFGPLSAALNNVSHWSVWDASTGGNLIYKGSFATPRSYVAGDQPPIPTGGISITEG